MFRYRSVLAWGAAALFLAAIFVAVQSPHSVLAQTKEELLEKVDDTNAQIKKIQDEIKKLESQLTTTSAQKLTLQNTVKGLDLQIQKLQKSLTLTQSQINQKDKDIKVLGSSISTTEGKIDVSQDQVATTLRELDQITEDSMVAALLGEGTLASFFDQAISLATVRDELQNHIEDLAALKTNLSSSKKTAEERRRELAALKSNLADEQKGVSVVRTTQSTLLTETKNQEATYQALIAQKKAEQASFEAELYRIAAGLGTADVTTAPGPSRGMMNWPLSNIKITQQFGVTVDSARLYKSGTHDGVDFAAPIGTPIKAALGGTVQEINLGVAKLCQYGKWVLIKHDNGLSSLYAHLSQVSVNKGDRVQTGQTVGLAGDTGYAYGSHLHFTVYVSSAVKFATWNCNSGATAYYPYAAPNAYLNPLSYLP